MKVKNAPLEAANVAILLEHIPVGSSRTVHSLHVERVESDHYRIDGGPVIDLSDAMQQIGIYSGKHSNPGFVEGLALGAAALYGYEKLSKGKGRKMAIDHMVDTAKSAQTVVDANGRTLWVKQIKGTWHFKTDPRAVEWESLKWYGPGYTVEDGMLVPLAHNPTLYPGYELSPVSNPFVPAVRSGLLERMELDGADTFAKKVKWVSKHVPDIDDPNAFVAVLVRGEKGRKRNPEADEILGMKKKNPAGAHRYTVLNSKGHVIAHTTTKAEAESVCPRGGHIRKK